METFDWSAQLAGLIPQDWIDTHGQNVKIALIDTGVNLNVHSLSQLDKPGHKFFVGRTGFSILDHTGKDAVGDGSVSGGHGTELAVILSGKSNPAAQDFVDGIAPAADMTIIKARDNSGSVTLIKNLLDSIELAADLGVEIAITAQALSSRRIDAEGIAPSEVQRVMNKAKAANMLLFAATENRSVGGTWDNVVSRKFPNNQDNTVNVAVVPTDISAVRNQITPQKLQFLLGGFKGLTYDADNNLAHVELTNSAAVAIMGGIAALCLSALKSQGSGIANLLATLAQSSAPLQTANGNYPAPIIFKNF